VINFQFVSWLANGKRCSTV